MGTLNGVAAANYTFGVDVLTDIQGNVTTKTTATLSYKVMCNQNTQASLLCPPGLTGSQPCSPAAEAYLSSLYNGGNVRNCQVGPANTTWSANFGVATPSCNSSFTYNGATYENLYAFASAKVPGISATGCSVSQNRSNTGSSQPSVLYPTSAKPSDSDDRKMEYAIRDAANGLFGNGGYFASAIIHNPASATAAACAALAKGEENGTKYSSLLHTLGFDGNQESVCGEDYSAVLSQIAQFVKHIVQARYSINYQSGDKITAVAVQRDGQEITLQANSDYTVNGDRTVTIQNPSLLSPGDSLAVTISTQAN